MSRADVDSDSMDYLPHLPVRRDYRIGVIGSGFIVRDCHLVAYASAGFKVAGIASRNHQHARAVAAQHAIPQVYNDYREMLDDESIEVVDIAVPPDRQLGIIRDVVMHNEHVRGILAQKPLAMNVHDARQIVALCQAAGVKLGVNQNMRYDQSVRALKCILDRGYLGEPVLGTIEMRAIPHWMPWSQGLESLSTYIMSIHHLDTFRYWFGDPARVLASTRPDPRTKFPHRDGINLYILEYEGGCRAAAWDDVWAGPAREGSKPDIYIRWRVEGTEGMARGTIGWPDYPARTPSTLDFTTNQDPDRWHKPRWKEVWFPDAFVGTMAQLLCAIEQNAEPEIGGRDNLHTIALAEAVCRSAKEHRAIDPINDVLGSDA
jgi:predicted dehydrogenase